ncbi:MAG: hypothetical protein ACI86M_000884 [Saprospiraceae bacterium]|jgi:hypothetical protein
MKTVFVLSAQGMLSTVIVLVALDVLPSASVAVIISVRVPSGESFGIVTV